ncbi:TonB-dependent receptor [Fulvivirga sp. RKSG066]|uniref:SusC/RagA family TonB-linked outer membrane protein n=1 Tax=Fulvivirga aurantia TaxID=2529383 RepID=UPI0012BB8437|nr:TonB-dependent receptor [Fulvivirga aurantia]MTI20866.1 TonB-dependent receptor [Fulvivirga aurantia]
MRRQILFVFVSILTCVQVYAQTSVKGRVTSAEEGDGLPGVSVIIKGTSQGTVTDFNGNYTLEVGQSDATLVYSFVGMQTKEVSLNGRSVIDVVLSEDITQLSELVVVGYGTQKRKDITSSISTIDSEEIQNVPATYSFDGAIQGKTSGLNISSPSATPGAAINVNIRGVTSISASSQPLYVIDGIPIVTGNNSTLNSNIQPINPLADINPNDIASISVLKDASAASIYGSRGANGVIIITTKRGEAGKTKFNASYNTGVSEISNTPELMNSQEWISFMNAAAEFDGRGENFWNNTLGDPNDPTIPTYNAYDYIFRTGITHDANISMQGGDEKLKFFMSANYFNQEGIQIGQDFERMSARLNLDKSVSDKVGIGTNLVVSRTNHNRTINENDEYGVVINAQAWDPTAPVINDDGTYVNPFTQNGWWALENPLLIAQEYVNTSNTNRVLASIYGTYDITEQLSFKSTWSVDYNELIDESFTPAGYNESDIGIGVYGTFQEIAWLSENTLTYDFNLNNDHNLNLLGGFTMQESTQEFSTITGTGYPVNSVIKTSAAANTTGTSGGSAFGFISFIARANYSYKDKYLANFTVRSDGSSRFGSDNRYGTFPSGSLGWRVSEEAFFDGIRSTVSNLKFRASYGIIGNASIGNFTSRSAYSTNDAYNGQGGIAPSVLGNPDLGWEKTTQLNLGLDLGLFDDRINFNFDVFKKNTTDLLLAQDIPGSSGYFSIQSNFGEIENRGLEASLQAVVMQRDDFQWNANLNFTYVENEVIDIVNDGQIVSRNFVLNEGQEISQLYLIKFLGVDPFTGDAVFEDTNSDGIIDLDDRQPAGSGLPTYFGGVTNTFKYKGLSLDLFFQFSGGNKIFNQSRHAYENYGSLQSGLPYGNQSRRSLNYWRQPGDITDIPRPSLEGPGPDAQWQRFSTQYLEDGDYLRLKNVKLSYTLPGALIEKTGLTNVQFFVQGRNLITWTNYLGFDPEVSTNTSSQDDLNTLQGEDFGTLGQARTYSLGVNLGF